MTAEEQAPAAKLIGTWRIVSEHRTILETGETIDANAGAPPTGILSYGSDGRMLVLLVKGRRPKPTSVDMITDDQRIALFRSMAAYGGRYTFDGAKVVHHVDISWNETWTGTTQVRHVSFDGERLVLTTDPMRYSADGRMNVVRLVWERMT